MKHDPDRLVTPIELWLRWADAHGVRYADAGKSFDDVARDCYQASEACRELLTASAPGDVLSATHMASSANTAYAHALLINGAVERRGCDLHLYVHPTPSRCATRTDGSCRHSRARGDGGVVGRGAGPVRGPRGTGAAARRTDHGQGVPAVTEPMLPLPDVPLIIEDLLVGAKQLADAGAHREAIEERLDHVAALRDGLDS